MDQHEQRVHRPLEEIEAWQQCRGVSRSSSRSRLTGCTKDNVSGGAPYGIALPDGCADAHFVGEVGMPLVGYLRWVFHELAQELQPL
jgi:hypothetical protein